ncbi:putative ribosome-binding factor chloroplastic [Chlorella sorokiniana]|uniref:Ribosome-binding factor chloroplastic n=1 Tax=Chlorella sorokiniana TaxID=3076 RepID=A0A2P6U2I5_CHLSO|nr:putative ribosome-binding factor chloroplastic [Chlorella sorokiniana]|eukprot:PRW60528.1 putative ribosome-binding factor chloroplastic [Chlorella sorokiniana]
MQCSRSHVACKAAFRPAGVGRLTIQRGVVCMAHPRRVAKVAKQIEREVGNLLITDKILQAAVCPERRRGFDGALSALASVTEVHISNDLQVAKVYLSIYSDDVGKAAAMEGLQKLEGYVRRHIGKQIRLRLTPEIRFVQDDSIERSERIFKLLDQVKKIERGEAEPPPLAFYGDVPKDEEEWEEDEDEGDFTTVDLGMFGGPDDRQQRAAAAPSAAAAAAAPSSGAQQQAAAAGKQQRNKPQPAARQRQSGGDKEEVRSQEDEEELAEMLAAFKRQMEQRRGRL